VSASSALSSRAVEETTRLSLLRAWVSRQGLDAAYITRPVSIAYLTGFRAEPFERLMALAVRPDGATLIVPAIEREKAAGATDQAAVVAWRDGEDPYKLVRQALEGGPNVGVEKDHLTVHAAETLLARTAVREMVDVSEEIRRLRRIKTAAEVALLARAAAITDDVTEQIAIQLQAGQSELEVAVIIDAAIGAAGGTLSFESLVQSGPNSALPHHRPGSRKLAAGDLVLLDFGAGFEGYRADTTRMAVVGTPNERQLQLHSLVLAAHDAAIAEVRAGTTTGAVDAAARNVIAAAGMADAFFHRVGHGLGLDAHEDPSLDPGSTTVLEPGMVFTIEPGVYIPGWGGIRIEDDVVVEDGGCRVLTKADHALRVIAIH
jgi:Xaa-Pro dipeptidase